MKFKFIYIFLFLFFIQGCCIKEKIIYLSDEQILQKRINDRMDLAINAVQYSQELREWYFVNEKKLYTCGFYGNQNAITGGCHKENLNFTYEETFNNWFGHYTTLKKLEKKWKNKPLPEYLKKAYLNNSYIIK